MNSKQIKVPATYMRGGTSKGVFFNLEDLPEAAQVAGEARDALLLPTQFFQQPQTVGSILEQNQRLGPPT